MDCCKQIWNEIHCKLQQDRNNKTITGGMYGRSTPTPIRKHKKDKKQRTLDAIIESAKPIMDEGIEYMMKQPNGFAFIKIPYITKLQEKRFCDVMNRLYPILSFNLILFSDHVNHNCMLWCVGCM